VISFYRLFLDCERNGEAARLWHEFNEELQALHVSGTPREGLNAWFYNNFFCGVPVRRVAAIAREWWRQRRVQSDFWIDAVVRRANKHRHAGHELVLVTGSFREVIAPLANLLGAKHALIAPLEERSGIYTGRLNGMPMIGEGKGAAVATYIKHRGFHAKRCYGYGDDESDLAFLERVGNPVAVANGPSVLASLARTRNWRVLEW
jgi:HAD superfamily hydrolase (TIGR01490 family)